MSDAGPVHAGVTVEQAWQRVPGGSASYLLALLDALRHRDDVRATGLAAAHRHHEPDELRVPVPVRSLPLPRYALYRAWNHLSAPRPEWLVRDLDVVHASTWAIPPTSRPLVVTVHDVAFLRDPAHFTPRGVRFFTRALERTRDEAAAVVVPSRATADDCVAAGIAPERLHVVPHGAPGWTVTASDVAEVRTRLGLPERFVLWCGTFEPRKNVGGLLAAFARLAERDPDVRLVLVGPPGWGEVPARPAPGPWERRVVELGRLSTSDLRATYAAAAAFCFPSTWEGFGLPVLEAMSVGTPVVTSRGTSMAEVVAGAGVLVDPLDPEDLAAGMERALSEEGPLLGAAGRARSQAFTWSDAAARHAAVYRGAAAGR
ncbi:glycosyltransferase family 1 protein [Cellulomonas sp. PS-H5]|uniref:glycosyltransferase family 4 protein n=1 Tax=Cellulomonas sp. PS-H5 TaxID=2820400 RepID=UPI001C4FD5CE|nr:glycosyltransferase family 1 protein [Cellulomonas sp. PS-H5]MBW0254618.1 glycosyltransferase family 4 protein [Cellulomonas sp. PS-H5]